MARVTFTGTGGFPHEYVGAWRGTTQPLTIVEQSRLLDVTRKYSEIYYRMKEFFPESEIGWVPAATDVAALTTSKRRRLWDIEGIEDWLGYFKTAIEAPYKPWKLPELWGKTFQIGETAVTTGKLPTTLSYEFPQWPEFPGWPEIPNPWEGLFAGFDWTQTGESLTKFGTMGLVGLGLVAVIMFLK